jgi:hypothetical protein
MIMRSGTAYVHISISNIQIIGTKKNKRGEKFRPIGARRKQPGVQAHSSHTMIQRTPSRTADQQSSVGTCEKATVNQSESRKIA